MLTRVGFSTFAIVFMPPVLLSFYYLFQQENEISGAISQMIEGQSYINRKERHLRLMEKALQSEANTVIIF